MQNNQKRVALVTGGNRGIGFEITKKLAVQEMTVLIGARNQDEGVKAQKQLKHDKLDVHSIPLDVTDAISIQTAVGKIRDSFKRLDVLVNNAAVSYFVPIKDMPLKQWDISWAVGPRAIFILTKEVLPDMINRRSGAIVNISSGAAIGPGRGPYKNREPSAYPGTKYGAEKAAIERFSQGLAEEVYQYGISVTALSPSQVVVTPGTLYFKMAAGPNDPRAEPPEMMARAALLLATEPLDKITGRVTYSQAILKEFSWITEAKGIGIDRPGTGYSQV